MSSRIKEVKDGGESRKLSEVQSVWRMVKIYLVLSKKDVLDKKYKPKTLLLKGLKKNHLDG